MAVYTYTDTGSYQQITALFLAGNKVIYFQYLGILFLQVEGNSQTEAQPYFQAIALYSLTQFLMTEAIT